MSQHGSGPVGSAYHGPNTPNTNHDSYHDRLGSGNRRIDTLSAKSRCRVDKSCWTARRKKVSSTVTIEDTGDGTFVFRVDSDCEMVIQPPALTETMNVSQS